jgi:hypothetical protein
MLHTDGIESGLLPTIQTQGLKVCNSEGKTEYMNLNLLPTPQAIDGNGKGRELRLKKDCNRDPNQPGSWRGDLKDYAVMNMLPMPRTSDFKGASKQTEAKGRNPMTNSLMDAIENGLMPGSNSQLNPLFVAELMGYPPDWLELPFQNTETKA